MHRFVVMIVRKRYVSPYRKTKYLTLDDESLRTEKKFCKAIEAKSSNWRDATYFLRDDSGKVFARLDIKNGKVTKIYKTSPATEEVYPVWNFIKR